MKFSEDVMAEKIPYGLGKVVYGGWDPDILLTLNPAELKLVEALAVYRHNQSRGAGINNKNRQGGNELDTNYDLALFVDRIGAAAEMAYCKFMGMYWEPRIFNFKEADVGQVVQIRGAASRIDSVGNRSPISLIVRKNDNPEHYYVLVEVNLESKADSKPCWVHGWIYGEDAMRDAWWGNKGKGQPCWWVPQEALIPFYV